ncbi:hypothetical protein AVEN_220047-1 [Araneus ventricosus]|uniref:Uncharacterized protein n=1 Tax=Araneus ventricosus TaxID=182803 RepID=A0A4Y2CQH4_ARAVE|nr:hypothetical protein AVEN_220047-1 [Araneus ventricosus]
MAIDNAIPVAATLTDLEICQAVCEQAIKVDDSDVDDCVEENPPKNAEMRQALVILKRGVQHRSTNFKKTIRIDGCVYQDYPSITCHIQRGGSGRSEDFALTSMQAGLRRVDSFQGR